MLWRLRWGGYAVVESVIGFSALVITRGVLPRHVKRFNVFPRVCRTDLTQMATAYFFWRFFRVRRTFFSHEQNFLVSAAERRNAILGNILFNCRRREWTSIV